MKTGKTSLRVASIPVDANGNKVEPEEQPTQEITSVPVDVNVADHPVAPGEAPTQGSIGGIVNIESTAGDVARDVSTRCELCEHWRHEDWQKHLSMISDTVSGQAEIEKMRGELLGVIARDSNGKIRPIDHHDLSAVNRTIQREFGICALRTEVERDIVATPFYGGCPVDDSFFRMRDRDSRRLASAGYDHVMRLAQGRKE
jgi:hypothetical protein